MSDNNPYPGKRYASYVLVVLLLAHIVAFLDRQILASVPPAERPSVIRAVRLLSDATDRWRRGLQEDESEA